MVEVPPETHEAMARCALPRGACGAHTMTCSLPPPDIPEHHGSDQLRWTNRLLASITRAQSLFIEGGRPSAIHSVLLQGLVEATESTKGVLAAVEAEGGGPADETARILCTHGTGPDEDEEIRRVVGDAIAAGQVAIGACARGWNCISIPVFRGTGLIGVIALAGSARGYTVDTAFALDPITTAFAALLHGIRNQELHQRAEASVARQNKLLDTLSEVSPVGIFRTDAGGMCTHFNQRWAEFTGLEVDAALGLRWHTSIHPDDRERTVQAWTHSWQERTPFALEFRYLQPNGRIVWAFGQALPVFDDAGAYEGHIGVVTDITNQKEHQLALARGEAAQRQASSQLRQLANHLLNVREEERTRIARELHDDLGQTLTALRMELGRVRSRIEERSPVGETTWQALEDLLQHSITSLRETCADLRPAVLDDLGLAPAIAWLVRQFRERTGVQVDLQLANGLPRLPDALSTDIFRILQESLTNISRHSGASRVVVTLGADERHVRLAVEDNGRGLPADDKARRRTFGILGMQERALRCQGTLAMVRPPQGGTRVELIIPVDAIQEDTAHDPSLDRR